jgi:hypothetical protein
VFHLVQFAGSEQLDPHDAGRRQGTTERPLVGGDLGQHLLRDLGGGLGTLDPGRDHSLWAGELLELGAAGEQEAGRENSDSQARRQLATAIGN